MPDSAANFIRSTWPVERSAQKYQRIKYRITPADRPYAILPIKKPALWTQRGRFVLTRIRISENETAPLRASFAFSIYGSLIRKIPSRVIAANTTAKIIAVVLAATPTSPVAWPIMLTIALKNKAGMAAITAAIRNTETILARTRGLVVDFCVSGPVTAPSALPASKIR